MPRFEVALSDYLIVYRDTADRLGHFVIRAKSVREAIDEAGYYDPRALDACWVEVSVDGSPWTPVVD